MEEKQTLKQWLDALEAQGHEVKVTWEGGNDNGVFYVYVDDEEIDIGDDSMGGLLIDIVADYIGYGSFAGDYSTNGELFYEDGHLSGTDFYSQSEGDTLELEEGNFIEIVIPDYLWFDTLNVNTEGYAEDGLNVSVNFNITNGPVVDEHGDVENELSESLETMILKHLNKVQKQVNYAYNEWPFRFDDGILKDGKRIFYIESIDYSYDDGEDKVIAIEITDEVENQTRQSKMEERLRWEKQMEEWNKNKS